MNSGLPSRFGYQILRYGLVGAQDYQLNPDLSATPPPMANCARKKVYCRRGRRPMAKSATMARATSIPALLHTAAALLPGTGGIPPAASRPQPGTDSRNPRRGLDPIYTSGKLSVFCWNSRVRGCKTLCISPFVFQVCAFQC